MNCSAFALLTVALAAVASDAVAAPDFEALRRDNLGKSSQTHIQQLREENRDKVDFNKLRHENRDKSAAVTASQG